MSKYLWFNVKMFIYLYRECAKLGNLWLLQEEIGVAAFSNQMGCDVGEDAYTQ